MNPRYTRPEMATLWSQETKYQSWLDVELHACEAMELEGTVPAGTIKRIRDVVYVDPDRIEEIEAVTRHDVIAFLSQIEAVVGEDARWIHLGLTSSDVVDTAFAWQLTQAIDLNLVELDGLLEAVSVRAYEHKNTVMVGRSHGMHAEPTTFGLVMAILYDELRRGRGRLVAARANMAVGKISGAVGTFANVPPSVEAYVCKRLGLAPAPVSSQILQRDRHAELFCAMAVLGGTIERFAVQVRHWQRTEVGEAEEAFSKGQKGSSAMPHKRNPIASENLTGQARILRGFASMALENQALWHERDISHSCVERTIGPDATTTLHYVLHRCAKLVTNLVVNDAKMRWNLATTGGLIYSQRLLLDLISLGVARQTAYEWVQKSAMDYQSGEYGGFFDAVVANRDITNHLSVDRINNAFDPGYHTRHVNTIFERVFG